MHLSTDMATLTVTVSHRLTSTKCVISREGVMVRCLDSAGKAKTFCLVSTEGEAERVGLLTSATHPAEPLSWLAGPLFGREVTSRSTACPGLATPVTP